MRGNSHAIYFFLTLHGQGRNGIAYLLFMELELVVGVPLHVDGLANIDVLHLFFGLGQVCSGTFSRAVQLCLPKKLLSPNFFCGDSGLTPLP